MLHFNTLPQGWALEAIGSKGQACNTQMTTSLKTSPCKTTWDKTMMRTKRV